MYKYCLIFTLLFCNILFFSQETKTEDSQFEKNNLLKELKGTWKLKEKLDSDYYSNIIFTKYIEIDNDKIIFYNDPNQILSHIDLNKNNFSKTSYSPFPSIQLDKEIWYFSIRKFKGKERLRLIKKTDKNGNLMGKIDDRAIIIKKRKRYKALEKEIYTYYIKKN